MAMFGGGLKALLDPGTALPVAAALMGGQGNQANFANALGALGPAMQQNRTLNFLRQQYPDLAAQVDAGLPLGEAFRMVQEERRLKAQGPSYTDDQREYQMARDQGFGGSFMDYQVKMKEAGRNQVNIDTGVKLPPGFRWKDPNNQDIGVEPIPGGPGEQIPGELAARVGMADEFLKQLPNLKTQVKSGMVTGPVDRTAGLWGYGDSGAVYQQIQSGVDVLQRLLTGAGMNQMEASQYAQRYLPTYADDATTMLGKLDRLERELIATRDTAMRGRGGSSSSQAPNLPGAPVAEDPLGIR